MIKIKIIQIIVADPDHQVRSIGLLNTLSRLYAARPMLNSQAYVVRYDYALRVIGIQIESKSLNYCCAMVCFSLGGVLRFAECPSSETCETDSIIH